MKNLTTFSKKIKFLFMILSFLTIISNFSMAQTIPATNTVAVGQGIAPTGWTILTGTTDISNRLYWAGDPTYPWNAAVVNPPNGHTVFVTGGWTERVGTTITGLTSGRTYLLTFYMAELQPSDPSLFGPAESGYDGVLNVNINGTITGKNFTGGNSTAWSTQTVSFVATGATASITFSYNNGQLNGNTWNISLGSTAVTAVCNAGTTQATVSSATANNVCPATTVNLNSLVTSTTPSGASLVWFTNNTRTGTAYATPTAATAGTYFAFYYDATNNCYNVATSTAQVTVTIAACCNAGTTAPSLSATTKSNTCPSATIDLTTITSSNTPSGASLQYHTAIPATAANKVASPNAVAPGTYYAVFYDAANNCYSTQSTTVTATIGSCGTIVCSKTQISTTPVAGASGQKTLLVTINVTVAGCLSPITISGSGMSLANGVTQVCTTTTGVQTFSIPVNYDGSALGTVNFNFGSAGSCSANLTTAGKKAVVDVWTLDCIPTEPPSLK